MMKSKKSFADVKRKPSYVARKDRREIQVSSEGKPQSAALTATAYALHHDGEGIRFMHTGIGKSVCLGLDAAELKMDLDHGAEGGTRTNDNRNRDKKWTLDIQGRRKISRSGWQWRCQRHR